MWCPEFNGWHFPWECLRVCFVWGRFAPRPGILCDSYIRRSDVACGGDRMDLPLMVIGARGGACSVLEHVVNGMFAVMHREGV
jgi:hypothetical protein